MNSKTTRKGINLGAKHGLWKGKKASYGAIHFWMRYHFGRPNICEECGLLSTYGKGKKNVQWANLTGKFLRERSDWKALCFSCHIKYDIGRGKKHGGGRTRLTKEQVLEMKKRYIPYKRGLTLSMAKEYGIDQSYLLGIIRGRHLKRL